MKTKFKYQWNSFFDYLGAFDSSFSGKQKVFYQNIQNDPKIKMKNILFIFGLMKKKELQSEYHDTQD